MKANTNVKSSIRVNTGAKKIEVNDEGECITLNFGDQTFPTRFFAMRDEIEAKFPEFNAKFQEIDKAGLDEMEYAKAVAQMNLEIHEFFASKIDGLFGAETCRKVFGDIVPGLELYADFLDKISPFFQAYGQEKARKLTAKYNAGRKGNV